MYSFQPDGSKVTYTAPLYALDFKGRKLLYESVEAQCGNGSRFKKKPVGLYSRVAIEEGKSRQV